MERVNFRYAKPEDFDQGVPEVAVIDVSFISLKLMLPPLHAILKPEGEVIALIKPQFEAVEKQSVKTALFEKQQPINKSSNKF